MKTRIIQNEPAEPAKGTETVEATVGETKRSNNLAARMGRWSAGHKKTAIFGWLAFVAAAFMIGNAIGTKKLDPNKSGAGESGHVDAVLADEFKQPQGDSVLIQSTSKTVDDPAFRAAIADVTRTVTGLKQVKKIRSPLAAGNEGQISKDRHTALVDARAPDDRPGEGEDPRRTGGGRARRRRHPASGDRDRGVRRQRREAARRGDRQRLQEGRHVLAADHADRPRRRVRRARRRRPAVAARAHRGARDDGAARDPEPADAARLRHRRDRAADRPRRRRRLLALLPEARARGACRRPQRARCARGRGGHVGPGRADLGPDRDGRHGRDALHRRQDVHGLRHRDDDRGRGRRARLAHRPAGPARRARRQRRPAEGAVREQAPPSRRRQPDVERDPRSRPAPPARLGRARRRAPARARRSRAAHAHRNAGPRHAAAEPLGGEDLQQAAEGVPRPVELGPGRREDRRRPPPGGQDGDRRPAAHRDRDRAVLHPDRRRDQPARHDRGRLDRGAGERTSTRSPSPRSRRSAPRSSPRRSASSTAPTSA